MRPPLNSFVVTERPPLDAFRVAERSPEPEDDMSYIQRVASQYQTAGKDISSAVKSGSDALRSGGTMLDTIKNTGSLLRTGLRTAGAVAQASFAPIIEAPGVQQVTKFVGEKLLKTPLVGDVIRDGVILAQKYPEASRDVRNIFDIVTLGTGKAVEAPLAKEVGAIGRDVVSGTKAVLTPSEEAVQNRVVSLFQKSIKPTAKKTSAQATRYETDTLRALKTIKANSDQLNIQDVTGEIIEGRTPQTINELAQGLEQTKSLVFKQYDALAKQAGTGGATIDALPIAEELFKVSQNRALQLTNPEIIKYAENWATRLNGMGKIDSETAQEVVKLMNSNLEAFYRNPTYDSASKVAIDAGIANNFRVALDDAIGNATGADYQALKNQYSALKAIENDVVRASMRDARRNTKGLLDYSDIFTGGQMLSGILSLNPAMFTKGAIERGFKEYIKMLNDPNRAVGNMFEALDIDTSLKFTPESATFKALQNPSLGMSIKDVSKNPQDLQRFQSMKSNTPNTTNPKKTNISPTVPPKATPSTPLSTLEAEAKKYKTAEEFVKAQPVVYHGSGVPLKKFNNKQGTFFTDDMMNADGYAGGENVYEGYLNLKNPLVIDAKGALHRELDTKWGKTTQEVVGNVDKTKYDGVIFKNIKDSWIDDAEYDTPSTIYYAFKPADAFLNESQLTDIWKKANGK